MTFHLIKTQLKQHFFVYVIFKFFNSQQNGIFITKAPNSLCLKKRKKTFAQWSIKPQI